MKNAAVISLLVFFLPLLLNAEAAVLKLRASKNPDSVRIVFEGPESAISKGSATQKGNDIIVSFPTGISIQAETDIVDHRVINNQTVRITPGAFSGIKVFTLKDPSRLVIDAYAKEEKEAAAPVSTQKEEMETAPLTTKAVVIDPGHGGYESGIVKEDNKEKNTVLDIARKLGALVSKGPSKGFLTRGSDLFMGFGERVNFANSKGPDVFISLHIGNHRDIVIYTPVITDRPSDAVKPYLLNKGQAEFEEKTLTLLKAMSEAVMPVFGEDMLSIKPVPYSILSRIEAAALIIELPSYEYAYYSEEYNSKIANTLYKGLHIYEENN